MTLERALEVALAGLDGGDEEQVTFEELNEAAAVLREFMEKGLPFYRAAEEHFYAVGLMKRGWSVSLAVEEQVLKTGATALRAFIAMKEATK